MVLDDIVLPYVDHVLESGTSEEEFFVDGPSFLVQEGSVGVVVPSREVREQVHLVHGVDDAQIVSGDMAASRTMPMLWVVTSGNQSSNSPNSVSGK